MNFKKYTSTLKFLPYIFHIIYFNFKYLPFKQAIKLPILLYKPKLINTKGQVLIEAKRVYTGMIRLGINTVSVYPNNGIIWENNGGESVFKGPCHIGNSSAISIGKHGKIIWGNDFLANAAFKICSYKEISFGDDVQIGWENTFLDTDFHALTDIHTSKHKSAIAPIIIGNNNWFGLKCLVLKGTQTSDYCTVGAYSLLNKKYLYEKYSVIAGNPVSLKSTGLYWNKSDDKIKFE
jgi:acetyltransferase-like isoleucine patch superfamily enzyme